VKIHHRNQHIGHSLPTASTRARRIGRFGALRGQSMVEFALVAPLYFLLTFAVIDFGRMFFVQMSVQQAVQEAARYASTGQHLPDPNNPGQNLSRVASITQEVEQDAIGANVTSVQVSSLAGGTNSAGGPGDTVTVSVTTNLALMTPMVGAFFPGGAYTFTASATFKNEPFSSTETN
jgi:Flp pilus assembly protein TadG